MCTGLYIKPSDPCQVFDGNKVQVKNVQSGQAKKIKKRLLTRD